VEEVIPERHLMPVMAPPTYVVATPFPPDDRSVGYERGTSISKAWDQATTDAALEVAAHVAAQLDDLAGTRGDAADRAEKLCEFCRRFAERAFRRPLTDAETTLYIDRQFDSAENADTAVKRAVLLVLKSPRFLYQEPLGAHDPYTVAARLAFDLWDSLPDAELLEAAASGQLTTHEQIEQQAQRLAADTRARTKLREFLLGWLKVDHITDLAKDPQIYPEFNAQIASDLRTSLDLFVDEVISSPTADFRQLLLAEPLVLNGRLAKFYGAELPEDAPFQKVSLPDGSRAGVLTHPFLLSGFAYTGTTSPIHRGVFLARSMLGRSLRPPPEAVSPLAPDLHADLTTRERVSLQTNNQACQTCHQLINPLGFTLEHYDAVGRYRERENAKPIDATGSYLTQDGKLRKFGGVRDLATFLAQNPETHAAVTEQLFQYLVKQPIQAFGREELPRLRESFVRNDFNLRQLMVDIATSHATKVTSTDP
jgi:hypothetical protein